MDTYYPEISSASLLPLRAVREFLEKNPGYLDDPDCPYPKDIADFLRHLHPRNADGSIKVESIFDGKRDKWSALEDEAVTLYNELKQAGHGLQTKDNSEKMSFFRTRTSLLEKIVAINERALGLRQIHEFKTTVLNFIDAELTPDQRTRLMSSIKSTISSTPEPTITGASEK